MVGHVTPEAFRGGPLAALEEGDTVVLDVEARELRVELSDDELAAPAGGLVAAAAALRVRRPRQVRRGSSPPPRRARSPGLVASVEDEPVAVDDLEPTRPRADLGRRDRGDSLADRDAASPTTSSIASPGPKPPSHAVDADGEDAGTRGTQRPLGARIEHDASARPLPVSDPELERRLAGAPSPVEAGASPLAGDDRAEHRLRPARTRSPSGCPAPAASCAAAILLPMPPRPRPVAAAQPDGRGERAVVEQLRARASPERASRRRRPR